MQTFNQHWESEIEHKLSVANYILTVGKPKAVCAVQGAGRLQPSHHAFACPAPAPSLVPQKCGESSAPFPLDYGSAKRILSGSRVLQQENQQIEYGGLATYPKWTQHDV